MSEDRPVRVSGGMAGEDRDAQFQRAWEAEAKPLPKAKNGEWTGQLQRGGDEGTVRGWLYCQATGGRIEFTGVKDPRPNHGYLLLGRVVPV